VLRLAVQCGTKRHVTCDIRDGDNQPPSGARGLTPHRIIEITRIFTIDSHQRHFT
jgi:hypothetical protein